MHLLKTKKEKAKELSDEIFNMLDDLARAFPLHNQEIESHAGIVIMTLNIDKDDPKEVVKESVSSAKKVIDDLLKNLAADADRDELPYSDIHDFLFHFSYSLENGMPFFEPKLNKEMREKIENINNKLLKKIILERATKKWKEISEKLDKLT